MTWSNLPLKEARGENRSAGEKWPDDPYYSREEIDEKGVLQGKGYELAWLKDPWERYVLHVQGSGKILLPDGRILRVVLQVQWKGLPEHRPFPGGPWVFGRKRAFPETGEGVLEQNPGRLAEFLSPNERYIFFRLLPNQEDGPSGFGDSFNRGRSIATDFSVFPKGALAY